MSMMLLLRENNIYELQGGMSNELYNTIARVTDGIYEGTTDYLFQFYLCIS